MEMTYDLEMVSIPVLSASEATQSHIDHASQKSWWGGRVVRGIHAVGNQHGRAAEAALATGAVVSTAFMGVCMYFSAEGAVRIFATVGGELAAGQVPSAIIGHAGEWSAQVLVYPIVYVLEAAAIAHESEYETVLRTYETAIKQFQPKDEQLQKIYHSLLSDLHGLGDRCFLAKSRVEQHRHALHVLREVQGEMPERSELALDRRCSEIFDSIAQDLKSALGSRNYFRRLGASFSEIKQEHGWFASISSAVSGIALPVILGFQAFLNLAGAGLVLREVYWTGGDPATIGHFGEWPVNAVTFIILAWKLHTYTLLSHGDYSQARQIIQRELDRWADPEEGDPLVYERLCTVLNDELERLKQYCLMKKLTSTTTLKAQEQ